MLRDGLSGDEVYLLDALDLGDGFDDLLLFASWKAPVRKQEVVVDLIILASSSMRGSSSSMIRAKSASLQDRRVVSCAWTG